MRTRLIAALIASTSLTAVTALSPDAEAARTPDSITSVSATPGPGVGEVTIRWKTHGANTKDFAIETALTSFSKSSSSVLPYTGRHDTVFTVSAKKRSVTLSAKQVARAGAAPSTGNHLFFRVTARNGSKTRAYGNLLAVAPRAVSPKTNGSKLRIGTFNVRSAKVTSDVRPWLKRAPEVAGQIKKYHPDVMALQELSPGRADGKSGATTSKVPRQTESLVATLKKQGAGQYKLVRTTSYVKPGTTHGTQATRILYNSSKLTLLSKCADKTGSRQYSTSCSFDLPTLKGESKSKIRSAAYAEFKDKKTGKRFLFVSVHLDYRQSGNLTTLRKYDKLRGAQMATVYAKIKKVRKGKEPVIVAGDYNSWQNNKAGNAPHDYLVSKGYYDTASAKTRINMQYPTYNNFAKTLVASPQGFHNRIDQILITGAKGASRFENVTKRVDSSRPSDHNLVVADTRL